MDKTTEIPDRSLASVLVVDDDDIARRSLTEILRLEGYQVEQTGNATEAVEVLQQKSFDLVLLDLRMPIEHSAKGVGITEEQAGLIVLRFVAEKLPDTPVIILTAHGSLETAIEALRYRAEDYLLKPATPEQILATLDSALWRRTEKNRQRSQATALKHAKSIAEELAQSLEKLETSLQALRDTSEESVELDKRNNASPESESGSSLLEENRSINITQTASWIELGNGIKVDFARREIRQKIENRDGMEISALRISLTPTEGKLLEIFIRNPGKVFLHQELVLQVQGYETSNQEAPDVLRPLISRLRHKLETFPDGRKWIRSIRGIGYTFEI